jgi:flavin-dependent dehydrogenase
MYDALVIGARCAGAATAMLLARRGHKVLLLDRSAFPSDIPHGHFIHRQGPAYLHRWGLLEQVVSSGCPAVDHVISDFGDFPLECEDVRVGDVAFGCGPRRRILDAILVDAAVAAGAEFRPHCAVENLLASGDSVGGVRCRDTRTQTVSEERARLTIGADGRNSPLARAVQAPVYDAVPALTCYYFSYWADVPGRGLELYLRDKHVIFAFPTNGSLFAIFAGWPVQEFPKIKSGVKRRFLQALDAVPALAERVRCGRRAERFYGTADLPNFFRKPIGPGWALVGDAGHHKDPFLALGVRDAFAQAELLAEAAHGAFSGVRDFDDALRDYERVRNESSIASYRLNLDRAAFLPAPRELLELRAALRGHKEDATRFWLAEQGMIPREEFFNPGNIERLQSRMAHSAS